MEVEERCRKRYIPGQELYLAEATPQDFAEFVIDNSDFSYPRILKEAADQ